MSIQELATISQYSLNIKIIIINNGWQGMVRQWQEAFYGNRFSNSYMKNGMPRFDEISKAYGLKGVIISEIQELKKKLIEEEHSLIACLFDVDVIENENCYPMVSPGRSNSQMIGLEKK